MIFAFDVAYNENNIAQAAAVGFRSWDASAPEVVYSEFIIGLESYQPGEFYKRELPCIERLLSKIDLSIVDMIIVDSYVYLDDQGKPGLGAHLFNKLNGIIPVIGVAKSMFAGNNKHILEVYRGQSNKPLYVSAIGVDVEDAAANIQKMHGSYRMPTILKKLDQLSRR